jgi:hypothetical protein
MLIINHIVDYMSRPGRQIPVTEFCKKNAPCAKTRRQIETPPPPVSMSPKRHQRSDRNAEGLDLIGAAEIRQIYHETNRTAKTGVHGFLIALVAPPAGLTSQAAPPNFGRKT